MRLTLATSTLLALPAVSSSEILLAQNHEEVITKRANSAGAGQRHRVLKNMLHAVQRGYPKDSSSNPQVVSISRQGKTDLFENTGVLTNKNHRTLEEGDECDPTAPSIETDTGILQCGGDELSCTEDVTSAMGGVCTYIPYDFGFASFCYVPSCDCNEFDEDTETGTIKCEICNSSNNLSGSIVQTIVAVEGLPISRSSCGTISEPYEQSYCYNVEYDLEESMGTCEIAIGNQTCASCVFDNDSDCGTTFDCTNADNGQAGESCNDFPLPILEELDIVLNNPNFDPADGRCDGAAGLRGNILAASTFLTTMVVGYLIA